jgi:hypothetical protein
MFKLYRNNTKSIPITTIPKHTLNKNIPLLPYEVDTQRLTILPVHELDFNQSLNSIPFTKTIVHVFEYSNGIADYLRGSILLAQSAKKYNLHFKLNVSPHSIHSCLKNECDAINSKVHSLLIDHKLSPLNYKIVYLLEDFIKSNEKELYINTNIFYDRKLLTDDIKQYINSFFTFKSHYYEDVKRLFPLTTYQVLHIRCKDSEFTTRFTDNNLLAEIIKLQLPVNTIVISNNYHLKQKIHKLFGFYYLDIPVNHIANTHEPEGLYSTIIEYIVLSKSSKTYCFSYYEHGSGFSEQCSILNDIPYSVVFLPVVNPLIKENVDVLLNYYDSLEYLPSLVSINKYNIPFKFITLVYEEPSYVLNSIQSLKNINLSPMDVYCIGEDVYSALNKVIPCDLICNEPVSESLLAYHKLNMIYTNLVNHEYVCITNPDVVYENENLFHYAFSILEDNDVLVPAEYLTSNILHIWMFIKSNETTRSLFNPTCLKSKDTNWNTYVNDILYKLKLKKLPPSLFSTHTYYEQYHGSPYAIYFNKEKESMIRHHKWYTLHKVNVCQVYTTSFSHYIEGVLRLVALHLQHHAIYYHTDTLPFSTELSIYLNESLHPFSTTCNATNQVIRETRSFREVLTDQERDSTVYHYDGIMNPSYSDLPHIEIDCQFELCIPKLRELFVNAYLPPPSYDHSYINVLCHNKVHNEPTFQLIKLFQKYNQYRIILYTTMEIDLTEHTILHDPSNELQMLSDFIHADILIMNYLPLTIAAHLLAGSKQHVLCPYKDDLYSHRLLKKCVHVNHVGDRLI